eukprot:s7599_g2.t1
MISHECELASCLAARLACAAMEAVGNIMLSLHRNLQEIQTSLDGRGQSREHELLQNAIDRAEQALRSQADL